MRQGRDALRVLRSTDVREWQEIAWWDTFPDYLKSRAQRMSALARHSRTKTMRRRRQRLLKLRRQLIEDLERELAVAAMET